MHWATWQWVLGAIGALCVGLSKGGISGLGIVAVPLFALILPGKESVGTLLLVLISGDLVAVTVFRRNCVWAHVWHLCPWAGLGVISGAVAYHYIPDTQVGHLIGAMLVMLTLFQMWRSRLSEQEVEAILVPKNPSLVAGTGILAGFATMIANAAGPVMTLYLLAMRLPKLEFLGTAAWYFCLLNLFKVPFAWKLGMLGWNGVAVDAWLIPCAVAGALSGRWLIRFVNQKLFEDMALFLTLVASLWLLCGKDLWMAYLRR